MTDQPNDDEEFERRLRSAVSDPVPDDLIRISNELFTWRTIDAELAELEASDLEASAGVRGAPAWTATFTVDEHVIEVEVEPDSGELIVDLGGRWADRVDLVTPGGERTSAPADEAGVARFAQPPTGPVQLVIDRRGGEPVKTRWITL